MTVDGRFSLFVDPFDADVDAEDRLAALLAG